MKCCYLVRYGSTCARVARCVATTVHKRGEKVVIRSRRGTELGEVLIETSLDATLESVPSDDQAQVLRSASPDDVESARAAEADRSNRHRAFARVLNEGRWPIDLIDTQILLDSPRVVFYYAGPRHLDLSALHRALRDALGFEVLFEPVGIDALDQDGPDHAGQFSPETNPLACRGCNSEASGSCGGNSACGDCAVQSLRAADQ